MNAIPRSDDFVISHGDVSPASEAVEAPGPRPTPLTQSAALVRISKDLAELLRLYGRGPLLCCVEDAKWWFRWRNLSEPLTGVALHLRIGDAKVVVLLETLAAFGSAADAARAELPAGLRAAFLNGLGVALWQQLEIITKRAVQVVDVRPEVTLEPVAEHVGFEIGRESGAPVVRGLLRLAEPDSARRRELQRVLCDVSLREMPGAPLLTWLRLSWAAVVGSTRLPAGEVRGLEEHDVVLIDDAKLTPGALNCWLGVGPTRRHAGRVVWRGNGGQTPSVLQMVEFGSGGGTSMGSEIDATPAGFDDIPVSLRFELAQWNASLAEVGNLAAGAVLDIGQRIDEHAVSVWVEQRCIGKGQLVAIGERLGVRLVSVFNGLAPPETIASGADSVVRQVT